MCSIAGDSGDVLMPSTSTKKDSEVATVCVKCGEPGCVVTRIQDSFCKSCFQVYVVHKFRAAIGKSKLIRDGERVLVAYSGGHNSGALLHLIEDGLSKRAHKKLRFTPVLLHIDESCVPGQSDSDESEVVKKVIGLMTASGFPAYTSSLEVALTLENPTPEKAGGGEEERMEVTPDPSSLYWRPSDHSVLCQTERGKALRHRLSQMVGRLASMSAKEDFLRQLRLQLLAAIGRHMGLDKVLLADCTTRLAVRILSDIAQGRGSQVAFNTRFCDDRRGDVMFLRPVRDLSSKELAMYNFLFQVDSAHRPSLSTKCESTASVERLTQEFIMGLQAGYQSTVSNVVRTSEKLGLPEDKKTARCWLCQSPLDTQGGETSALMAIEVSLELSKGSEVKKAQGEGQQSCDTGGGQCCGEGDGSCQTRAPISVTPDDVNQGLCYGCRLSLRDYKGDFDSLPDFLTREAVSHSHRQKLREEIADFLLDDDEDEDI